MSLTDLKKTKDSNVKKKKFTIDEFIADAENYAKGMPEIVSSDADSILNLKQAILETKRFIEGEESAEEKHDDKKPFRRATFTLSEDAISQLQDLSLNTDLAKSHIIRILIDELCVKEQYEQLKKLLQSKIN